MKKRSVKLIDTSAVPSAKTKIRKLYFDNMVNTHIELVIWKGFERVIDPRDIISVYIHTNEGL